MNFFEKKAKGDMGSVDNCAEDSIIALYPKREVRKNHGY